VIYLRYAWERAGLPDPAIVSVSTLGPEWVSAQVTEEMALLFPHAEVVSADGARSAIPDLAVLASASGVYATRHQLAWMEAERGWARLGLALYTMAPRHFEVVPVGQARRWARMRLATNFALRWRRRWARAWRRIGAVCASSS
jgi:hypothetical protein